MIAGSCVNGRSQYAFRLAARRGISDGELHTISRACHFQLDENNQLYWEGKKVRTQVTLPAKIDWAAWIIAAAVHTLAHWNWS